MESDTLKLVLYSTDHCTLCDRALELLFSMPELAGRSVRVIDVATDDALTEQYGQRLPVLAVSAGRGEDAPRELDWPFDAALVSSVVARLTRG